MTNKKQLIALSKSLEQYVKENDREGIILKLAELQVLIDEPGYEYRELAFEIQEGITHDIIEASICKDIKEVDKLFKEVDIAKKELEKTMKIPKPKLTKKERIEREVEKLEKKGLPKLEAIEEIERRELAKSGLVRCPLCGDYIDIEHGFGTMAPVRELGIWYHLGCLEKSKKLEQEIAMGMPMMREGMEVYCSLCHEPITLGQDWFFDCPAGEDYDKSAMCKYFHNYVEPPLNCWRIYYDAKQLKQKK